MSTEKPADPAIFACSKRNTASERRLQSKGTAGCDAVANEAFEFAVHHVLDRELEYRGMIHRLIRPRDRQH